METVEVSSNDTTARLAPPAATPTPRGFAISGFHANLIGLEFWCWMQQAPNGASLAVHAASAWLSFLRQIVDTIPAKWTPQNVLQLLRHWGYG